MSYTGGDVLTTTCSHPVLGLVTVKVKAAEDNSFDIGGVRGVDDKNLIASDGTNVRTLNMARWEVKLTVMWDMMIATEKEKLIELAASPLEGTWKIPHINGSIYMGQGAPVGDITANVNNVTIPLTLQGGGGGAGKPGLIKIA